MLSIGYPSPSPCGPRSPPWHRGPLYFIFASRREGYPHRLRAIGHLHEAENESQAWPDLHNAIREARKAYQAKATMPDFAVLAQRIAVFLVPTTSISH